MKKILRTLTVILILSFIPAIASAADRLSLSGKIAGMRVRMSLVINDNGTANGTYYYLKYGSKNKINLTGLVTYDGVGAHGTFYNVQLKEITKGQLTGVIEGELHFASWGDGIDGTHTNARTGRQTKVELNIE